jgi:hypothetical protein
MIRRHVRHALRIATIVLGFSALCAIATATPAAASSSPIGALDVVEVLPDPDPAPNQGATPGLRVAGWAIDPDASVSTVVHIYLNGSLIGVLDATRSRTDVAVAYPSFGALHGYDATLSSAKLSGFGLRFGNNTLCAYGIDTGTDANALLGCRTVTGGRSPFGSLDVVDPLPGGHLRVSGWVIDPDAVTATGVHVWIDGTFKAAIHAGRTRVDVGSAFPAYGSEHGFDAELDGITDGAHTICVYGIDTALASGANVFSPNPLLGCRQVKVGGDPVEFRDVPPIGSLDLVVTQGGAVRVAGWAIDPDTATPITVQVFIDGQGPVASGTADRSRTDVEAAYPLYGDRHGYDLSMGPTPGSHALCVVAIDSTTNAPAQLGCRSVTV